MARHTAASGEDTFFPREWNFRKNYCVGEKANVSSLTFKDEAQTALFKDPVRTAL
jgi:hypothetical protein